MKGNIWWYVDPVLTIIYADIGAAYGTAKSGEGILKSGIHSPELIWRNLIPVVMAGVNGIYGLITSIIIISAIRAPLVNNAAANGYNQIYNTYSMYTGCAHLAAGLCCGLSGLGSGMAIGAAGNSFVVAAGAFDVSTKIKSAGFTPFGMNRTVDKKKSGGADKLFIGMVLIQVFAGNVALYGLISSILLSQQVYYCDIQNY
jgi:V-type H+-transporting ATPase proteolipid subunit